MAIPKPKSFDPSDLEKLAHQTIRSAKFPMLATIDADHPRLRPVSPVKVDRFTIYVANLKPYQKTAQIAANPNVELCYLDSEHNQVRISGTASVVTDTSLLQEIWDQNPLLRNYLGEITNPQLIIYKITPRQVRYMKEWALEYHDIPL
ncbi:pyridoxamine 5'-phosphate oxidase family protein [Rubritalea tangerina]|uniref:Pyridoxamine 5'-phosphate oxidase family protein n=2 Tax=Rubritalea tangerina TaxID=430798 RepID=A0ABW4ZES0_9BACT